MNYRENRVHSSKVKPFSYYQCLIPDEFAYAPMHWHSEFEINFVREGFAEFNCGDEKCLFGRGYHCHTAKCDALGLSLSRCTPGL